jgi:methylglutaconyl-CoA hydratase
MTDDGLDAKIDDRGVAAVTLNRPAVHNAFDDALVTALSGAFKRLHDDQRVRVIVLRAEGKSFSAGADLSWMRRMAGYGEAENLADAERLAALMTSLRGNRKPTLAVVQGAALGGGVGLVAACDIAVAAETASFGLSEVKLGLIPRFDAREAHRLGLVHELAALERLDETAEGIVAALLAAGPEAVAECKALIARVGRGPIDAAMIADTARRIARLRASAEGREGVSAFLEKRKPGWLGG